MNTPDKARLAELHGYKCTTLNGAIVAWHDDRPEPDWEALALLPLPPPTSIRAAQMRCQLIEDELDIEVINALNAIPDSIARAKALARFEYETNVERGDPLVKDVQAILEKDDAWVDQFFIRASQQ